MPCPICDDTGWKSLDVNGVSRVERCDCWRTRANERAIASARIQRRYGHCELTNFEQHTDSLRAAYKKSVQFIERFPVVDRGLLFLGTNGVGKTHLAVAILKAVVSSKGARGYFYETGDLLKLVRDTYGAGTSLNEMDVLRPVLDADLLVLDDLGVERTSEWVQETLGHVVNIRYSERRATVFTTNLEDPPDPMHPNSFMYRLGPRTRSRLFEMCDWIRMDAIDAREVNGPDATPDAIQSWEKRSPASPRNKERSRGQFPAKTTGQLRAEPRIPREKDGKADLKWPGGRAGSQ
ncbi:MAG TPA: ATP-binding protein [Vicinamibacterales bacterium]|nr:ATP-binding protein [Vicinamibacterales bacterium]